MKSEKSLGLDKLRNNKDMIILSEIGALIHDVGKLNKFFVEKQSIEGEKDPKLKKYRHGDILEYDSNEQHNDFYSDDKTLKYKAEKLKNLLTNTAIKYNDKRSNLYSFIKYHHCNDRENGKECPDDFVRLLKASDSRDAEEDRNDASDNQSVCKTYYSNAFGCEEEIKIDYRAERTVVYDYILDVLDTCDINAIIIKRRAFFDILKKSFSKALGMTARAANDVSLWEHSYMTASIMKALLGESIIKNSFPIINIKQEIIEKKPFKILSIGGDFFDFLAQSEKIPDVVGRIKVLEEIKKEIKNLIEVEFLLGNCIYEDDSGIHFLIPASFEEKNEVGKRIFEIFNNRANGLIIPYLNFTNNGGSLVELIPKAINELRNKIASKEIKNEEFGFKPKWIKSWSSELTKKKLICTTCGKGFYYNKKENDEKICETCKDFRKKGREDKLPQTTFIDEIAWNEKEYENVALINLNFNLDNWLNGKYIKSLCTNKGCDTKNLSEKKGNIKYIIDPVIGQKTRKNERLTEEEIEKLEKDISNKLSKFVILNGDAGKITQGIINKLKDVPANEIKLDQILDEILDGYKYYSPKSTDMVPKTPSPSRLMRVWSNTYDFFKDLEKDICKVSYNILRYNIANIDDETKLKNFQSGPAIKIQINGSINGECILKEIDGKLALVTITPHLNKYLGDKSNQTVNFKLEYNKISEEFKGKVKDLEKLRGYRIISISPNQFLFMIPASKSLEVLEKIKKGYMDKFGKVYGKLPLNAGVVYFKRKTPFYTVLDSARRFRRGFEEKTDLLNFKVEVNDAGKLTLVKSHSGEEQQFREGIYQYLYKIKIPSKLGNEEPDGYYPYPMTDEGKNVICTGDVKHVLFLEKGDTVKIHPSSFDFEFLDSNQRRFDIVLQANNTRKHFVTGENGPRPYLLEDLEKFQKLRYIFKIIKSWTPIKDIEALAISKRQEWSKNGKLGEAENTYRIFIDSLLENKLSGLTKEKLGDWEKDIKPFLKKSIMEGSFFDAIELFSSIMKIKFKGDEND